LVSEYTVPAISSAIGICLAIEVAQGQVVIFSNLTTPNNTGADVIGLTVPPTTWAGTFMANGNFNLVDVKVSVASTAGDPTFNVFLAGDVAGAPDRIIHWRQIGFGLTAPSGGGVVTANSNTSPIALTSGNGYWIVVAPAKPQSRVAWNLAPFPGNTYTEFNHSDPNFLFFVESGWIGQGGFPLQYQVDGTPPGPAATPLPPSLILCLTGLAIVGLYQMRRKLVR
jgi:hypothetical protein